VSVLSGLGILLSNAPDAAFGQAPASKAQAAPGKNKPAPVRDFPGAGTKQDAASLTRIIDQEIQRRLAEEKIPPSPPADDAEFLRRVHLDLVGVIPPLEKVKAFLKDNDPDKRARLVEELLADARFGRWMAEIWTTAMLPRESNNRLLRHQPLLDWMADHFNNNTPWNKTVHELLTASGEQDKNGAVTYFAGNNTVDKITDSVTRLFLGVRLECAQCHNHPFTSYKQ